MGFWTDFVEAGKGAVIVEIENKPATLTLDHPVTDVISGRRLEGTQELAPYTVMVVKDE